MARWLFVLVMALVLLAPCGAVAQDEAPVPPEDGPPISITSPDSGTTYAYGTLKSHSLTWDNRQKVLIAHLTFIDENPSSSSQDDDTHDFRLPGVSLDEAKGLFTAKTAKGEVIPVARYRKVLFLTTIESTPNAAVRVIHPKGNITVILEAISPDDPAMHAPGNSDPNGTHAVAPNQILN